MRYVTVDVFTDRLFGGNPLAVVLDARGLSASLDACIEDPATGSASAATIALLATLAPERSGEQSWRIEQGVDMGRPSLILGRTVKRAGAVSAVHIAGRVVPVMHGHLTLSPTPQWAPQ